MVQKQLDLDRFAYKKKDSKTKSQNDEKMQNDNTIEEDDTEETNETSSSNEQKKNAKRKVNRKRKSDRLKENSDDEDEQIENQKKTKKSRKSSPKKKNKRSKNIVSDEEDDDFVMKDDDAGSDNDVELVSEEENVAVRTSDSDSGSQSRSKSVTKSKLKKKASTPSKSKQSKLSKKKSTPEKSLEKKETPDRSSKSSTSITSAPIDLNKFRYSTNKDPKERVPRDPNRKKEFQQLMKYYTIEEERRKLAAAMEAEDNEVAEEEPIEEEQSSSKTKKGKKGETKLTPLEQQVFELKKKYPGVVMIVEVGYKYVFFEEDAKVASNVLGIVSFKQGNFTKAVIPTYRLGVHLRKIVGAGYKIGIINQTETAMIKASSGNKQGPFTRDLEGIYSKGTLVLGDSVNEHGTTQDSVGYLVSISERHSSSERIRIHLVAVNVSTGEIMHDSFDDTFMRRELDSRLCQLDISEFILPESQLSEETEKLLKSTSYTLIGEPRYERIADFHFGVSAKNEVEEFYSKQEGDEVETVKYFEQLSKSILELPEGVIGCINALIEYLKLFKLEKMLRIPNSVSLKQMSSTTRVLLSGITLRNLEIFRNSTNGEERGSLFSILNHTKSHFGKRLLREWISHPLANKKDIQQRLDAVEELASGKVESLKKVPTMLKLLPDLEKSLMKTFYKKCSPKEFLIMLKAFEKVYQDMPKKEEWEEEIKSELLRNILDTVPENLKEYVDSFLDSFSHDAAMAGEKSRLFFDNCSPTKFPEIYEHSRVVSEFNKKLDKELVELRNIIEKQNLEYKEWKNEHYVVELTVNQAKKIPSKYAMIHQTKTLQRFQLKYVQEKAADMKFHKEKLEMATTGVWDMLLADFAEEFANFRDLVDRLASLDCLFSLAHVATKYNYCKPELTENLELELIKARHPVIEQILDEPFVPNNISMSNEKCRAILLTGPNLGGKSTISRTIALNALLAQIGSYVPCQKAVLPIFDGIYIRMGASDSIFEGKSTFYVELSETAEIMRRASPRSLVILDELGRGTSTFDGKCLAYATLEHFVTKIQSFTVFVTHYQSLVTLAQKYSEIQNYHMGFVIHDEEEEAEQQESDTAASSKVTFTYTLKKGFAKKSFGLNVARLAGIPPSILQVAAAKSNEFEEYLHKLEASSIYLHSKNLLEQIASEETFSEELLDELKELQLDVIELESRVELFNKN